MSEAESEALPERFLIFLSGPEIARPVLLDRGDVVVGRTRDCGLMIHGAGVSRRHFVVRCDGERTVVEDLGSMNGTLLNEQRLGPRETRTLRSGDRIGVGNLAFKYLEHTDVEARYHATVFRLMATDALTQLENRRFLEEQLEREISRSGRYERTLSIVLIDIDHFKHVNDTFGHLAGDAVLQQTGSILGRSMRREDCVGRFGGDEFLVLLPETKPLGARFAGDAFFHEAKRLPVTISAGVAAWRPGMDGAPALLEAADRGLYAAKNAGRNRAELGE